MNSFYTDCTSSDWLHSKLTDKEKEAAKEEYYFLSKYERKKCSLSEWFELYLTRIQTKNFKEAQRDISQYLNTINFQSRNDININGIHNNHHSTTGSSSSASNSINSINSDEIYLNSNISNNYSNDYNSKQNETTESDNSDIDINLNFNDFDDCQAYLSWTQSLDNINSNNNNDNNFNMVDFTSTGSLLDRLDRLLTFDQQSSNQSISDIQTHIEDKDYFINPPEFERKYRLTRNKCSKSNKYNNCHN